MLSVFSPHVVLLKCHYPCIFAVLYLLGISTCLCELILKTFTTLFHIIKIPLLFFSEKADSYADDRSECQLLYYYVSIKSSKFHPFTTSAVVKASSVSSCAKQIVEPCHIARGLPVNTYCIMMVQTLTQTGCIFHVVHLQDG